jgi:phenylpropionate dioxygenase-like ring-hydroxylating dioxygenase large terminal subunit
VLAVLDQWHPIYPSRRLGRKPVALKCLGRELVLFRTAGGGVGVMPDCCPHRGMRLSLGQVRHDRLVCPYHGWCFDTGGQGESPGSPKLHVQAAHFEAADHRGLIWIKNPGGAGVLPPLQHDGYELLYLAYVPMKAPVESLMENFTEIEHTGTAHWQFGYDGKRMAEVQVEAEADEDTVRVWTAGPQMRLWKTTEWALGTRAGDILKFDWTTRFAPLHSTADFWWEDPRSGEVRPCRFKETAYFIPVGPQQSLAVSYYFWSFQGMRRWLRRLLHPFVALGVRYEISLDRRLIENVVPQSLFAPGRRLGRFDKGLQELRKRWQHWRETYAIADPAREASELRPESGGPFAAD